MPDVFQLGDYTASVRVSSIRAAQFELLEVVARDCPVNAITVAPVAGADTSRYPTSDDDEKSQYEEDGGEIGEYKRKHGYVADRDEVEPDDAERLEGGEHDFSIVRNGSHHD